jgi:Domain of unknown function (DUF1707)
MGVNVTADFPGSGEPADMRASDADRDRVIDVLRAALGDGRLSANEFEERLEATLSSRTLGELAGLTADLVAVGWDHPGTSPPGAGPPGAASVRGENVMRIDHRGGSVQRTGRWVVPRRLELRSSWCDVKLDFTDAIIEHETLHIEVNMRGGSLTLVTRPGIVADADALTTRYADVDIRPDAEPGGSVILRIHLVGRMRYGVISTR